MVQCPDCNLSMTQHTLKSIHKKGYCKGAFQEVKEEIQEEPQEYKTIVKEPGLPKQKPLKTITNITDEIVKTYIKENLESVTSYLRNERVMKHREQMHVRTLLNNALTNV